MQFGYFSFVSGFVSVVPQEPDTEVSALARALYLERRGYYAEAQAVIEDFLKRH